MKKILCFVFIILCSCNSRTYRIQEEFKEEKLYLNNKLKYINILAANFVSQYRMNSKLNMQYKIAIEIPEDKLKAVRGSYVIIKYQIPSREEEEQYEEVIHIIDKKDKVLYSKSKIMYNFISGKRYKVKIYLTEDKYGHKIIDRTILDIVADVIPHNGWRTIE